jgi:N-terminal domain of toast_rack, DUF2154
MLVIERRQMMKHTVFVALAALTAASMACAINVNIPRLTTGATQTLAISEAAPSGSAQQADVEITMGAGTLNVSGGAQGLVEGQVQYNVAEWKPTVTHTGNSVSITQGQPQNNIGIPQSGSKVVNDWALKLGNVPMALTINAGAYQGTLSLGGLPLRSLTIHDGASNSKVTFDSANPDKMDSLTYETGASTVSLTGLANANAQTIDFTGGAGDYQLDFSGQLQHDISVTIKSGVSSVRLVVAQGVSAKVNVSGGLNNVNTDSSWTHSGDNYTQTGSGPTITINVDMGVGSLKLVNK